MSRVVPVTERIAAKVIRSGRGCLEWTGHIEDGYGRIWHHGAMTRVHRVAWELVHGPIPAGMMIDHLCHNRACCNVNHLRLATRVQNMQNRSGVGAITSTGVRGVRLQSPGKYQVRVSANGKRYSGGYFDDLNDAAHAAEALRARLHDPIPAIPLEEASG